MAVIIDPDDLTYSATTGTPVTIDTTLKTIKLNVGVGTLTTDGVTGLCLYSFLKKIWLSDTTLQLNAFPNAMQPITSEQFEFINGWLPADIPTRKLIRTAGWAEYGTTGATITRKYAGIVTLGTLAGTDQVYYQQGVSGTATNFTYAGALNEALQIYGDTDNGNFDYSNSLKLFVRTQGKTYGASTLTDIGVSTMTYQVYRFPLSSATDSKIQALDTAMTNAPYSGITVAYYTVAQSRTIGGTAYNFNIIITGNGASKEDIYTKVQYLLRQSESINTGGTAGDVIGKTAASILSFTGDTLYTATGVYIDNFNSSDTNNIVFVDSTGTARQFPYTAALKVSFNNYLTGDADSKFTVYFTNDNAATVPAGKNFGTTTAIIVNDSAGDPMTGLVSGRASVSFSYDYDNNVQRGAGSAGKDAPITVVASGLSTGQYVSATGTIAKSTANAVSLVAALERSYSNP